MMGTHLLLCSGKQLLEEIEARKRQGDFKVVWDNKGVHLLDKESKYQISFD